MNTFKRLLEAEKTDLLLKMEMKNIFLKRRFRTIEKCGSGVVHVHLGGDKTLCHRRIDEMVETYKLPTCRTCKSKMSKDSLTLDKEVISFLEADLLAFQKRVDMLNAFIERGFRSLYNCSEDIVHIHIYGDKTLCHRSIGEMIETPIFPTCRTCIDTMRKFGH